MRLGGSVFSAVLLLVAAGCQNSSRPGVTKHFGRYEQVVRASSGEVAAATRRVLVKFDYAIVDDRVKDGVRSLTARDRAGNSFAFQIEPTMGEATTLSVSILPGHNESQSLILLSAIDRDAYPTD